MENGFVVVTSFRKGLASFFVDLVAGASDTTGCRPRALILCSGTAFTTPGPSYLKRRLKKLRRIGVPGALNGLRMRRWYGADVQSRLNFRNVYDACAAIDVPVIEIDGFWDPTAQKLLAELNTDLGISLGNGFIPAEFFRIPRFGMINVHHELLPQYRGAQTAIWQLHDGSRQTGFSIHELTTRIDHGRILLRQAMPITFGHTLRETVTATAAQVQQRSMERLLDVVANFEKCRQSAVLNEGGRFYTTPSARAMLRIYRNHASLRRAET